MVASTMSDIDTEAKTDQNVKEDEFKSRLIGTDHSYTHKIMWNSVMIYVLLHFWALIGLGLCVMGRVPMSTIIWSK